LNDILKKAEELGRAISASDRFKAVEKAREEIDADKQLQADVKVLNDLTTKLAKLEKDTKPVEPDDKHRLRDLQQKVMGAAKMQELMRVEADFAELMNRVNRTIYGQFSKTSSETE